MRCVLGSRSLLVKVERISPSVGVQVMVATGKERVAKNANSNSKRRAAYDKVPRQKDRGHGERGYVGGKPSLMFLPVEGRSRNQDANGTRISMAPWRNKDEPTWKTAPKSRKSG